MKFKVVESSRPIVDENSLLMLEERIDMSLEHLEHNDDFSDLIALQNNIEKYGLTDQIKDLVGGTLEEYGVRLENKEVALEGIGEALKTAGKATVEAIKKLLKNIKDFIHNIIVKMFGNEADKRNALAKKYAEKHGVKGITAASIPPKQTLLGIIKDLNVLDSIKDNPDDWLGNGIKLRQMKYFTPTGGIDTDVRMTFSSKEGDGIDTKGYGSFGELWNLIQELKDRMKIADACVDKMINLIHHYESDPSIEGKNWACAIQTICSCIYNISKVISFILLAIDNYNERIVSTYKDK